MSISNDLANTYGLVGNANTLAEIETVQTILGANLRELWLAPNAALVGGAVNSIAGSLFGIQLGVVSATQRPVYAASDTAFGGRATIRTQFTSDVVYLFVNLTEAQITYLLGGAPYNQNLYMFCIARVTTPGAQANDKCLQQLTSGTTRNLRGQISTAGNVKSSLFNGATTNHQGGGAVDGNTHLFSAYAQGTQLYSVLDGVATSTALVSGDATWPGPSTTGAVYIGSRSGNPAEWIDARYALWGVCLNPPTSTEYARLLRHARSNYGVAA